MVVIGSLSEEKVGSDSWINICACLAEKLLFNSARYSMKIHQISRITLCFYLPFSPSPQKRITKHWTLQVPNYQVKEVISETLCSTFRDDKNVWGKEWWCILVVDKRVWSTINHISICFLIQYQRHSGSWKGIAWHTDMSSMVLLFSQSDARLAAIGVKVLFGLYYHVYLYDTFKWRSYAVKYLSKWACSKSADYLKTLRDKQTTNIKQWYGEMTNGFRAGLNSTWLSLNVTDLMVFSGPLYLSYTLTLGSSVRYV